MVEALFLQGVNEAHDVVYDWLDSNIFIVIRSGRPHDEQNPNQSAHILKYPP